ncbi:MAG: hypothetical protein IPG76_22630 [Acidobacteria bacterium]|nr:hypothetical protein [Acidobacteriota bacterium]
MNNQLDSDNEKKPYESPEITVYGTIADITQNTRDSMVDDNAGGGQVKSG